MVLKHEEKLNNMLDAVVEFETGTIIAKFAAQPVRLLQEQRQFHPLFGHRNAIVEGVAYYRKGEAPKCDYIKQTLDAKITYHSKQADIEVNRDGSALKVKKSRK